MLRSDLPAHRTTGRRILPALFLTLAAAVAPGAPGLAQETGVDDRLAVAGPGAIQQMHEGRPIGEPAEQPASAVDLRGLRLEPGDDDGAYVARLTFGSIFELVDAFRGGAASHRVFVSLEPPDGPEMRVVLGPEATASVERAGKRGRFESVGPTQFTIDGNEVLLEIPASVGLDGSWEVQPHAWLVANDGGGQHADAPQVTAASLLGEDEPGTVSLPAEGTFLGGGGRAQLWRPPTPMPDPARPESFSAEVRDGRVIATVTMADEPTRIARVAGARVAFQGISIMVSEEPDRGGFLHLYDIGTGNATVFDSLTDPARPTPVAEGIVRVDGRDIVFDLGDAGKLEDAEAVGMAPVRALAQGGVEPSPLAYLHLSAVLGNAEGDGVGMFSPYVRVGGLLGVDVNPPGPGNGETTSESQWKTLLIGAVIGVVVGLVAAYLRRRRARGGASSA